MTSLIALTILLAPLRRRVIIPSGYRGEAHEILALRTRFRICNTGAGAPGLPAARGSDPQHAGMERRTLPRRPPQSAGRHSRPDEERHFGGSLGDAALRRL